MQGIDKIDVVIEENKGKLVCFYCEKELSWDE